MSIRTATAEDGSGILVCLLAAFEEYRDSYTLGALADTVLTTEMSAGIPNLFSEPSNTNTRLLSLFPFREAPFKKPICQLFANF
jgi:hypothetical protein